MLDSIRSAKESVEQEILSLSGVNGLGIGEHPTRPDELAILIYTDPGSDQADALKTPETVGFRGEQFATRREKMMPASAPPRNLQVTFEGAKQHSVVPNLTTFVRPATGGCSVANYAFPIGTLGIAVIDARNDNLTYLLSCNHVLARLNCAPPI